MTMTTPKIAASLKVTTPITRATAFSIKSYYVEGGFCHLIHMTAAHLW